LPNIRPGLYGNATTISVDAPRLPLSDGRGVDLGDVLPGPTPSKPRSSVPQDETRARPATARADLQKHGR